MNPGWEVLQLYRVVYNYRLH